MYLSSMTTQTKIIKYESYLTEAKLGPILEQIFENEVVVPQFKFGNSKFRFDYAIPSKKLIVEYDGDSHYRDAEVIYRDEQKDELAKKNGFKVVRIPYFVQLDKDSMEDLFPDVKGVVVETDFEQGFLTTKILPASFCIDGIEKFHSNLRFFGQGSRVSKLIVTSLILKASTLGERRVFGNRRNNRVDIKHECVEYLPAFECVPDNVFVVIDQSRLDEDEPDPENGIVGLVATETEDQALGKAMDVCNDPMLVKYDTLSDEDKEIVSLIHRRYDYIT